MVVVNTCSFIDPAKQESVNTILEMAKYKETGRAKRLVVAGCLVELREIRRLLGGRRAEASASVKCKVDAAMDWPLDPDDVWPEFR